jgi:hypothetical protein
MTKRPWYITYDKSGTYGSSHAVIHAVTAIVAATKWQKQTRLPYSAITEIREIAATVTVQ